MSEKKNPMGTKADCESGEHTVDNQGLCYWCGKVLNQDWNDFYMNGNETTEVKKPSKPRGRRYTGEAKSKMLSIRFKSREKYDNVCQHAESQGLSINEWCVKQLLKGIADEVSKSEG
jgi:hypothetical protein